MSERDARAGKSLANVIAAPNPIFKGWFGYFKQAYGGTSNTLDAQIRRRLRAMLRKQQRHGCGHWLADHKRWTNAFFAQAGLFAMHTAWTQARHSR